jgi:hypothetical protein
MANLSTGMYLLTARGEDRSGNVGSVAGQYGTHQYYFYLTDEVPTPVGQCTLT